MNQTDPKILILDKIHHDGISFLQKFCQVKQGWEYSSQKIIEIIPDYDVIIVKSGNVVSAELIKAAKKLQIIGTAGSGTDNIDISAAKERGIKIITAPAGSAVAVTEYIISTILMCCHNIFDSHIGAKRNDFRRNKWCGRNLANLNVGVIGIGVIGSCLVRRLEKLCNNIYGYDYMHRSNGLDEISNFTLCNKLGDLLKNSDIVSLNLPLNEYSKHFLSDSEFKLMKPGAILINTSRGKLIDEDALLDAIEQGIVSKAVIDVVSNEPPFHVDPRHCNYSHPFINNKNIFYTPHIAALTEDGLRQTALELSHKIYQEIGENINLAYQA